MWAKPGPYQYFWEASWIILKLEAHYSSLHCRLDYLDKLELNLTAFHCLLALGGDTLQNLVLRMDNSRLRPARAGFCCVWSKFIQQDFSKLWFTEALITHWNPILYAGGFQIPPKTSLAFLNQSISVRVIPPPRLLLLHRWSSLTTKIMMIPAECADHFSTPSIV